MITVWGIFAAEWVLFMTNAWYLDQVRTGYQLTVLVLTLSHLFLFTSSCLRCTLALYLPGCTFCAWLWDRSRFRLGEQAVY